MTDPNELLRQAVRRDVSLPEPTPEPDPPAVQSTGSRSGTGLPPETPERSAGELLRQILGYGG